MGFNIGSFVGKALSGGGLDLLGIGTDALGSVLNYKAVQDTNDQNYKIFKETLEYNKPVNQMARFREAGLNPNLIYSQGNAGNATAMPTMKAPQIDLDLTQKLSTIYGIKNMREQNENLKQQNSLLQSQSSVQSAQAKKLELEINFFKKYGYWPSQEGSTFRGARTLLPYIGRGFFTGVDVIDNLKDRVFENVKIIKKELERLKEERARNGYVDFDAHRDRGGYY